MQELGHHEWQPVLEPSDVQHLSYVLPAQQRSGTRFLKKPSHRFFVLGVLTFEDFYGDGLVEGHVPAAIHDRHTALRQRFVDAITPGDHSTSWASAGRS